MIRLEWAGFWRRFTGGREESPHPDARALWLSQHSAYGVTDLVEYAVATWRAGLTDARSLEWLRNAERAGVRMNLNAPGILMMACLALAQGFVTDDPGRDAEAAVKAMEHPGMRRWY